METLMSDPDSVQKALPHPPEGFLVFFGARRRRVGGLGRPYLRALVALGRSWGKPLVGSRRSRIFELTLIVGSAGLLDLDVIAGWA